MLFIVHLRFVHRETHFPRRRTLCTIPLFVSVGDTTEIKFRSNRHHACEAQGASENPQRTTGAGGAADGLLHSAGYHLSRSVVEDMIFDACFEAGIHDLEDINTFLVRHECRPFVPQD